jgi:hypothetical protein
MAIAAMALVWFVALGVFLGLSLAVGGTVHWLVPSIDLGIASVIGAIGVIVAGRMVISFTSLMVEQKVEKEEELAEENEDRVPMDLDAARLVHILDSPRSRRTRRRK